MEKPQRAKRKLFLVTCLIDSQDSEQGSGGPFDPELVSCIRCDFWHKTCAARSGSSEAFQAGRTADLSRPSNTPRYAIQRRHPVGHGDRYPHQLHIHHVTWKDRLVAREQVGAELSVYPSNRKIIEISRAEEFVKAVDAGRLPT